jgi:hypothetical protein
MALMQSLRSRSQLVQARHAGSLHVTGMENIATRIPQRDAGLLDWQHASYGVSHARRKNLVLHLATVPVFMLGNLALLAAPFASLWLLPLGIALSIAAIAVQGKGHALEAQAPAPFTGPRDVIARIFAEQWITFPRFVLSGGLGRTWRAAA